MKSKGIWILLHLFATLVPLFSVSDIGWNKPAQFDSWPTDFHGKPLVRLELSGIEKTFGKGFPGHIARFTDGSQEIIIRWLRKETRKLHPAGDCLKGDGYTVKPAPMLLDVNGNRWGCVHARRDRIELDVCEIIYDEEGNSWSDVSSWYWAAILRKTEGPWWAVTIAKETGSWN